LDATLVASQQGGAPAVDNQQHGMGGAELPEAAQDQHPGGQEVNCNDIQSSQYRGLLALDGCPVCPVCGETPKRYVGDPIPSSESSTKLMIPANVDCPETENTNHFTDQLQQPTTKECHPVPPPRH